MTRSPSISLLSAAALALAAMAASAANNLSAATYDVARKDLTSMYRTDREACNSLSGNAKDVCVETAKGREKVALAHLQFQRSGEAKDLGKLAEARYEARYEVAKEVCDDQSGDAKNQCKVQAKSEYDKAKADAKMNKEVVEARKDAAEDKAKADYKVARERCETLAGEPKDACVATARARFGQ